MTDGIESRIALHLLAYGARRGQRTPERMRRKLLRYALCDFHEARTQLRRDATFCYLPHYTMLTGQWELWIQPFEFHKRDAPLVARRVELPMGGSSRDTLDARRGPDYAMHALECVLHDDKELQKVLVAIEMTTELLVEQHQKNVQQRKQMKARQA